jgi:hypothetical protein
LAVSASPKAITGETLVDILLFLGIPEKAEAAAALNAAGVGLLRANLLLQTLDHHPLWYCQVGDQ